MKNENINTRETHLSQTRRNNGIQNEPYFPRPANIPYNLNLAVSLLVRDYYSRL